jgi:Sec-independent protein secretion pathway component TatC
MFKFTIREALGLTTIAGVSFPAANLFAPADPISQLIMAGYLSLFGAACFVAGIVLERKTRTPNQDAPKRSLN